MSSQTYVSPQQRSSFTFGDDVKRTLHNLVMDTLSSRIKTARSRAKLTQEMLATACGVTRAAVSLWESDRKNARTKPRYEHLKTISEMTSQPLQWFLETGEIEDAPLPDTPASGEAMLQALASMEREQLMAVIPAMVSHMTLEERAELARLVLAEQPKRAE